MERFCSKIMDFRYYKKARNVFGCAKFVSSSTGALFHWYFFKARSHSGEKLVQASSYPFVR